ncbi:MAG: FAD-dependent oxidoreductase [Bacteroidales bacterium]|nr:FAD-dependent oxidoreductase [Bacteroidales bacterium]
MMNIAIVGAGAAGLFAASQLSARRDVRVTIFEKSAKVGTKLRASGGGRANILNTDIRPLHYNNPECMEAFLAHVGYAEVRDAFAAMGLKMSVDEEGRVYPATLFAPTVVNVLLDQLGPNVEVRCETPVQHWQFKGCKWQVNGEKTLFDRVILASGSPAGMIARNQQGYNSYLSDIKIDIKNLTPSLSGFKIKDYPSKLFGCRVRAEVALLQNGKSVFKESGEVIFKEDGISGIVILNCSAHYNRLAKKENCEISLNLLAGDKVTDVRKHLQKYGNLSGLLHPKLCQWYEKHPFDLRDFRLKISGLYGFESAQVCSGGIRLNELDERFQLKHYPGLYAIGEMVDIDGVCGGYNLFFAFASALRVLC